MPTRFFTKTQDRETQAWDEKICKSQEMFRKKERETCVLVIKI